MVADLCPAQAIEQWRGRIVIESAVKNDIKMLYSDKNGIQFKYIAI